MKRQVRPSPLQPPQQVQDLRLHGDVQRGRRLVAHEEGRIAGERPRDRDALTLPAGEFMRKLGGVRRRQPDVAQQLVHARQHASGGSSFRKRIGSAMALPIR